MVGEKKGKEVSGRCRKNGMTCQGFSILSSKRRAQLDLRRKKKKKKKKKPTRQNTGEGGGGTTKAGGRRGGGMRFLADRSSIFAIIERKRPLAN